MPKPKKSKPGDSVQVDLEKAEEMRPRAVAQVPDEIIASIKPLQQLEEDQERAAQDKQLERERAATRNKALFYAGVFLSVGVCYLAHRYLFSSPKPDPNLLEELVNETIPLVVANGK